LQQYPTPWIRPPTPRLFKEGWRAARPALSTWRFCTTGTDGLDDFWRMKDAFQGWKDAMPKDWTGGKLLDGKLDGWMKTAKTDEINRCKNSMPSWGKTHIYPKGIFKDVF